MATSYLSPGVYVEEVDRGSKPIEAVGTNTVGFLGESAKGPLNEAVLITNWSQFVKTFGDFKDCSEHLAHAVYGFFNNGGSRCFIVNVGAPEGAKVETKAGDKKDDKAPKEGFDGDAKVDTQGDLQLLCLGNGTSGKQFMNCRVGSDKGQPVSQFKPLLPQTPSTPDSRGTYGGFMHQLQGQSRCDIIIPRVAPPFKQVPCSQA